MIGQARAAVVFGLLLAGCASAGGFSVGEEVAVEGTVTALDPTPMHVDADGIVILRTETHGVITVRIPARVGLCAARGLPTFQVLRVGDRVRVAGTMTEPNTVRPCEEETHFLERLRM